MGIWESFRRLSAGKREEERRGTQNGAKKQRGEPSRFTRPRHLQLERFEERMLLAIDPTGPSLVAVIPNVGEAIQHEDVLNIAPRELLFRFAEGQELVEKLSTGALSPDADSLRNSIRIIGSGGDGDFTNGNEYLVQYGHIGLADEPSESDTVVRRPNELIVRFASTLAEDTYQLIIDGTNDTATPFPLRNLAVQSNPPPARGEDQFLEFTLDLGAQVTAVVPQPIKRGSVNVQVKADPMTIDPSWAFRVSDGTNTRYFDFGAGNGGNTIVDIGSATTPAEVTEAIRDAIQAEIDAGRLQNVSLSFINWAEPNNPAAAPDTLVLTGPQARFNTNTFSVNAFEVWDLSQSRNTIDVYFNNDELALASAENPEFYQIIWTKDTATPNDDVWVNPTSVTYQFDATKNVYKATLTFTDVTLHYADGSFAPKTIDDLTDLGNGAELADGAFRLRIGNRYQDQEITTTRISASEVGTSFYTADDVATFGNASGARSLIISGEIDKLSYDLEWPGALDEPGQRDLPQHKAVESEDHPTAADGNPGTTLFTYYFPHEYGNHPVTGSPLFNVITDAQKQRTREIFEIYGKYLGVSFQETAGSGIAIITGEIGVATDPPFSMPPDGPGGIFAGTPGNGTVIINSMFEGTWRASEFGGAWFQTAFHEIGHAIGLTHSYDLPSFTVMGSAEDATTQVGTFEPVFPGDYDLVHGQRTYRPDSTDIDLYKFSVTEAGLFSAEILAERMGISSTLDAQLILYEKYLTTETVTVIENGEEKPKAFTVPRYRVLARNDNYYSDDSYLEMYLEGGKTYYVGVSSTGNNQYDPNIDESGIGGTTDGAYELRMNFKPGGVNPDNKATFKNTNGDSLVDTNQTRFDGDADGVPGGVYDFWFNVQTNTAVPSAPARTEPTTIYVDKLAQLEGADGTLHRPFPAVYRALDVAKPGDIVRIVGNNFENDRPDIIAVAGNKIEDGQTFTLTDDQATVVFEFALGGRPVVGHHVAVNYLRADSAATIAASIANAIATSIADAKLNNKPQLQVTATVQTAGSEVFVRLTGSRVDYQVEFNRGNTKLGTRYQDNLAYEFGKYSNGKTLADGLRLEVPQGVTLMIDAGAILKFNKANIDVGSSAQNIDRSYGALQVLGLPGLPVYFTSHFDENLGKDTEATSNTIGAPGDWGGLVFRNNLDYDFIAAYDPTMMPIGPREVLETQGIFLNYVNHADIRYGGGEVEVNGVPSVYDPIHMVEARPTVTYNRITHNADAALSADPNSFADTKFQNWAWDWDPANPSLFTSDYDRVGPMVRNNTIVDNSINGMYIRVSTPPGQPTAELEIAARWDDWDVVHVVAENLFINGTPGGAFIPQATTQLTLDNPYTIQAVAGSLIEDGDTFSLFDGRTKIVFEFDRPVDPGRGVTSGHVPIDFDPTDSVTVIAQKIRDKIHEVATSGYLQSAKPATAGGPAEPAKQLYEAGELRIDASLNGSLVRLHVEGPTLVTEGFLGAPQARIDARLQIDPGLIVKLEDARIETEISAQLIAEGRAGSEGAPGYKVVFTSTFDSRYGAGGDFNTRESISPARPGDWGGLSFSPTSEASIDQAVIAYAGGITAIEGGYASFNPVEIRQATARITNTRFEFNDANDVSGDRNGRGSMEDATIYVRGAQPVIAGNDFLDNEGHAISIDVNSLKATTVPDWGRSTGAIDAFADYPDNHGPLVRENRMTGNEFNAMEVRGGNLTTESIWDDTDIVHVLYDEVIVDNFQHVGGLRLQSSATESLVVKLEDADPDNPDVALRRFAGFTATGTPYENDNRIGGSVQIIGMPGHPVVLTGLSDDSMGAGFDLADHPLFDTNGDGASTSTPGEWRGIQLNQYSNDRNVAVINEREAGTGLPEDEDKNATPQTAEALGYLAPSEKAGDDNRRLGFQVQGTIRQPVPKAGSESPLNAAGDADVYSFSATAGTEVWIDLDWTTFALDAIVELIDADGHVLARSDNSVDEQDDQNEYGQTALLGSGSGTDVRTMDRDQWIQNNGGGAYSSDNADFYTMNPRDAGMRLVLPGEVGTTRTYFVRVRNSVTIGNLAAINAGTQLGKCFRVTDGSGKSVQFEFTNGASPLNPDHRAVDLSTGNVADVIIAAINASGLDDVSARLFQGNVVLDGLHVKFSPMKDDPLECALAELANTSGKYQMQVRLREMQEIAGSTVRYADIRYATNGIEVLGMPAHSPLLGETAENTARDNGTYNSAQDIGNLLQTDRGTISVAGSLSDYTDVDWYRLSIDLDGIQSIPMVNDRGGIWATMFDLDYADGLGGADLAMFVFDADRRLLFVSDSSNISDDRPEPIPGATIQDLSQGSVGGGDPFIGTAFLSEGSGTHYYVAITSTLNVPAELLDTSPYTRREPLNSVDRVATEHFAPTDPDTGEAISDYRPYSYPNYDSDEFLGQRLTPIVNEFKLGDVIMYVNTGSDLYTVNPFSGQFETEVTPFPGGYLPNYSGSYYYNDIAMRNDGRLMTVTAGPSGGGPGTPSQAPTYVRLSTEDARTPVTTQSTGIIVYELATPTSLRVSAGNGVEFEALAHDPRTQGTVGNATNGSRVRTTLAVGNVNEVNGVVYGHNLVYLLDENGNAINHPSITSGAVAGGARVTSDIVPLGQFYTSPTIITADATQTQGPYGTPSLSYQQADMLADRTVAGAMVPGHSFTINDDHWVATFTGSVASLNNDVFSVGGRTFAFDDLAVSGSPTGSQVLVTIDSRTGQPTSDTLASVAARLAGLINAETNAEATAVTTPLGAVELHIGGTIRPGQEPRYSGDPTEISVQYRTGAPFVFELDFGVEVLTPARTPSVLRDGQTFTLEATTGEVYTFEFNSGQVLQLNNRFGLEGDVITVNVGGVDHTFVLDDQNVAGTLPSADFTVLVDSARMGVNQIADTLARAISREMAALSVSMSATAVNNRISLMGEDTVSYTDAADGTGPEATIDIDFPLTSGNIAIDFEESMLGAEFAAAFEDAINDHSTIEASYAYRAPDANGNSPGDRISFSGLRPVETGSETTFTGTPNWTYQAGTADGATPGRVPIALRATDDAITVATKIAATINNDALAIFVNATPSGGNVELTQINAGAITGLTGSGASRTAPLLNLEGDGPGGDVTGMAFLGNRLYAVTETGGLYEVTGWQSGWGFTPVNPQGSYNYIRRNIGAGPQLNFITELTYDTQSLVLSGLTAGPQNVENAKYSQMLFATDAPRDANNNPLPSHLYAIDTQGNLQPIFANSAERVQLTADMDDARLSDVRGVTFSPIDYNLWHMTDNRWADQGHGVLETPDATRNANFFPTVSPVPGDYSMYFGLEDPGRGTVVNQDLLTGAYMDAQPGAWNFDTTRNSTAGDTEAYGSYNMPGGAHGSLSTNSFSLAGYSSLDKPALYFTYYAETEGSDDYDGARVYISTDGAHWELIATNTDTDDGTMNAFQQGIRREMQHQAQPDRIIDEIVDTNGFQQGTWRQARVDLSQYAGEANLRLRFDFSTASDMGIGDDHRYVTSVPADWLKDGDSFAIDGQRFEFDLGYALQLPNTAGATIGDGEWFQIDDGLGHVVRFEFDRDASILVETDTLRQIAIRDTMSTAEVAQAILAAIGRANANTNNPDYQLDIATFLDDSHDQDAFGALVGTRIFLTRAVNVTQGVSAGDPGADVTILGNAPGLITGGIRVPLTGDMTREQVAEVITQVVNQQYRRRADINDDRTSTGLINNLTDPDRIQALAPSALVNGSSFTVSAVTQRGDYREVTFEFQRTGDGPEVVDATHVIVDLQGAANADDVATAIAEAITAAAKGLPELNLTATAAADIVTLTGPVSFFGGEDSGLTLLNFDPILKLDTQQGDLMHLLGHEVTSQGRLGYSDNELQMNPSSIPQSLRGDHPEWKDYTPSDSRPNDRYHLFERGQDNRHEGFYIDDIIIGFAERGEMVTGADAGGFSTAFLSEVDDDYRDPNLDDGENPVISEGNYQLEIRTGTTYGDYQGAGPYAKNDITQTFDTNYRLAEGITIEVPAAELIFHGQTFEVYDGLHRQTFVFLDNVIRGGAGNNYIPIYFAATYDAGRMSTLVADAINLAKRNGKLDVVAKYITSWQAGDRQTSSRVDLTGAVRVFGDPRLIPTDPDAEPNPADVQPTMYKVAGYDAGDRNLDRQQGQLIIESSQILYSAEYGIYVAPSDRDGNWTGLDPQLPHPGSGRSIKTPNNLVPGIILKNNVVAFSDIGGIYFSGETGQPTGAVPFGRIVNNTVYGQLGTTPVGIGIAIRDNASPTVMNNIVANVQQSIDVDNSSLLAGTIVGYNLYQNVGDKTVGDGANSEWVVEATDPLFVDPASENFYLAPGEDVNDNKRLDLGEDLNNDGQFDRGEDLNGNGLFDPAEDLNGDGILDPSEDLNGNGILDPSEDLNGDGLFDRGEDLDGDGLFDRGEDRDNDGKLDYNRAIDSSRDSLEERQAFFNSVLQPIGIPVSPILAPDRDLFGQLRKDDPSNPASGAGLSIKKDRGAIDRVDFDGPTASLLEPSDPENDGYRLLINETPLVFSIQLSDTGSGINDATVNSSMVQVYRDDPFDDEPEQLLIEGNGGDYKFDYNQTNDQIYLWPTEGFWASNYQYRIVLDNNVNNPLEPTPAIRDQAGNLLQPNQPDDSTQFVIDLTGLDFGDAPDTGTGSYPTTLERNGANHTVSLTNHRFLGTQITVDPVAKPSADASGDGDSDDGVVLPDSIVAGTWATMDVTVTGEGYFRGWVDYMGDEDWDDADDLILFRDPTKPNQEVWVSQVYLREADMVDGSFTLTFKVPATTTVGDTFARFRFSSEGNLAPTGQAPDGEVEDYMLQVVPYLMDYGDAPDSYGTLNGTDGARHRLLPDLTQEIRLGANLDAETDGRPGTAANGDDNLGTSDDEDGLIEFLDPLVPGTLVDVVLNVTLPTTGPLAGQTVYVQGWIDLDNSGSFDAGEEIFDHTLNEGVVTQSGQVIGHIDIPLTTPTEATYARFRVSTDSAMGPTGLADHGEVEDHAILIIPFAMDFGDAPHNSSIANNGPRHKIVDDLYLGTKPDFENDGHESPHASAPTGYANYDDHDHSDDEDGVTFWRDGVELVGVPDLWAGRVGNIKVTTALPALGSGYLRAWIDIAGVWTPLALNGQLENEVTQAGSLDWSFEVPEVLTTTDATIRFRLSDQPGIGLLTDSDDPIPEGEVEDYAVKLVAGEFAISGHKFLDLNQDGQWQQTVDDVVTTLIPPTQPRPLGAGESLVYGASRSFGFSFEFGELTEEYGYAYNGFILEADGTIRLTYGSGTPLGTTIAPFQSTGVTMTGGTVNLQRGRTSQDNPFVQIDWIGVRDGVDNNGDGLDNETNTFSLYIENNPSGDIVAYTYHDIQWATAATQVGFQDFGVNEPFEAFSLPETVTNILDLDTGTQPTYGFRTRPTTGAIQGIEHGLAGWTIYVDENDSGQPDRDAAGNIIEPHAVTDANGYYHIGGLFSGTYDVWEILAEQDPQHPEWKPTGPADKVHRDVEVRADDPDKEVPDINFGNYHYSQISIANAQVVQVAEGNSGTTEVQVTLNLADSYGSPVTIHYGTQDNTAHAAAPDLDYEAVTNGQLIIAEHDRPDKVWTKQALTQNGTNDYDYRVSGNLVLWEGFDGHDKEIFLYDGSKTYQLTNNEVEDRYANAIAGSGGTGWTVVWSQFDGNDYEVCAKVYDGNTPLANDAAAQALPVYQLTNNTFDDRNPQVSDSLVTWWGNTPTGSEVFIYSRAKLGTQPLDHWLDTRRLTNNSRPDYEPRLSGSRVVWTSGVSTSQEIYLFDGNYWDADNENDDPSLYVEPLTSNSRVDQWPEIDGDLIVWEGFDGSDIEIFMYRIGTSTQPEAVTIDNDGTTDSQPRISGNNIVWTRAASGGSNAVEIAWFNPTVHTTPGAFQLLTTNTYLDAFPRIAGNQVVWHRQYGSYSSNYEVIHLDLGDLSRSETNISNSSSYDWYAQVSEDYVVWRSYDGTDYEILIANQVTPPVQATFTLKINGDTIPELDESFWLNLLGVEGAYLVDANGQFFDASPAHPLQTQIDILNDDGSIDYGDAPASYSTLLSQNGARHQIVSGMYLGSRVDAETNGQSNSQATGDDIQFYDDEDGVVFNSPLAAGMTASITVTAKKTGILDGLHVGYLDAWIDFNGDGDWDPSEKLVFNTDALVAGPNQLTFAVPEDAKLGNTFARFRYSANGGLSYSGTADSGEVEDYLVPLVKNSAMVLSNRTLTVTGTDADDVFSFVAGPSLVVTLNGVGQTYAAADVNKVIFNGKGGKNQATLTGTDADETITASPLSATLASASLLVTVANAQTLTIDGGGGTNTATLTGTIANETITASPLSATLASSGIFVSVANAQTLTVDGGGGNNQATLTGTDADETITASPLAATLTIDGIDGLLVSVANAQTLRVDGAGGTNTATLTGTIANETIIASPLAATLTSAGILVSVANAQALTVDGGGGTNTATLTGTIANETITASPLTATLASTGILVSVSKAQTLTVDGAGGTNTATLTGTDADETITASPLSATLASTGILVSVANAQTLTVDGAGGTNTAALTGTIADETITVSPLSATLASPGVLVSVANAQTLTVDGAGGTNTATLTGTDANETITASPRSATLTSPGILVSVSKAQTLTVDGAGGTNTATLTGTIANETITVSPLSATLTSPGILVSVANAQTLTVDGAGGTNTATLTGTIADETITASPLSATLASAGILVSVANAQTLTVDGAGGTNTATLTGTIANETITASPLSATLTSPGLRVTVSNAQTLTVDGAGGSNKATITGTDARETITVSPLTTTLASTGILVSVANTQIVTVDGAGGTNTATITGTDADEELTAQATAATFVSGGRLVAVRNARTITVDGAGGIDSVVLNDSAGDDRAITTPTMIQLTDVTSSYAITATNFETAQLYARAGGADSVSMRGSAETDIYIGTSQYSRLYSTTANYDYRAKFFESVLAYGEGGHDEASLTGSAGDDQFIAMPATPESRMMSAGLYHRVKSFELVEMNGGGGFDTARLAGTTGSDTLEATPTQVTLTAGGVVNVINDFKAVVAAAKAGGSDVATLRGSDTDDTFEGRKEASRLSGTDYDVTVQGYGCVLAYAGEGGTDVADLYDTTGNDTFQAYDSWQRLYGDGFYNRTKFFQEVRAHATAGGMDIARLYGSNGNDTFVGTPTLSTMSGTAYTHQAEGFDRVYAYGMAGGYDEAQLFDSAMNDHLSASASQATINATDLSYLIALDQFDKVKAKSSTGNNTKSIQALATDFLLDHDEWL